MEKSVVNFDVLFEVEYFEDKLCFPHSPKLLLSVYCCVHLSTLITS